MESGSVQFSSVQSLSVSDCLRPDELQLAKPPESGRGFLFKSFVVTGAGYLFSYHVCIGQKHEEGNKNPL